MNRIVKIILIVVSFIGLALTILPSIMVFTRMIEMKLNFNLMIIGTILWFGTAPFWMKSKKLEE
jgi:hypothetical protein